MARASGKQATHWKLNNERGIKQQVLMRLPRVFLKHKSALVQMAVLVVGLGPMSIHRVKYYQVVLTVFMVIRNNKHCIKQHRSMSQPHVFLKYSHEHAMTVPLGHGYLPPSTNIQRVLSKTNAAML